MKMLIEIDMPDNVPVVALDFIRRKIQEIIRYTNVHHDSNITASIVTNAEQFSLPEFTLEELNCWKDEDEDVDIKIGLVHDISA